MMFMVGLERLEGHEKAALLAQMTQITAGALLGEGVRASGKAVVRVGRNLAKLGTSEGKPQSNQLRPRAELVDRIQMEELVLSGVPESTLNRRYMTQLRRIASAKNTDNLDVIAERILHRAAKTLGVRVADYCDSASLESAVIEKATERLIDRIKEQFKNAAPDDEARIEQMFDDEISRMSVAQSKAVRDALGVDELTGKALTTLFKTVSGTVIAQSLVGGAGFGAYLFLTAMIKAFSLLLGVVFPFSVYTGASTILAALLSPALVPAMIVASTGVVTGTLERRIRDEFAVALVTVGQAKLAQKANGR